MCIREKLTYQSPTCFYYKILLARVQSICCCSTKKLYSKYNSQSGISPYFDAFYAPCTWYQYNFIIILTFNVNLMLIFNTNALWICSTYSTIYFTYPNQPINIIHILCNRMLLIKCSFSITNDHALHENICYINHKNKQCTQLS